MILVFGVEVGACFEDDLGDLELVEVFGAIGAGARDGVVVRVCLEGFSCLECLGDDSGRFRC